MAPVSLLCKYSESVLFRLLQRRPYSTREQWKGVVGLEIHAQLAAMSKMFSASGTEFSAPVNSQVSPFDASHPGTLPVLNRRCVEAAVASALALQCHVNPVSYFDRKHYFYSDLPAGYQITQQRQPVAINGIFDFVVVNTNDGRPEYSKQVRVTQLQLEQDSGKSIHMFDPVSSRSLVDLNRAGVGLVEIVFEPDLANGKEATSLVRALADVLRTIGACDGKMEEGSLRVDVNVSVHRAGEPLGTRVEVKNLASANFVGKAVDYEIQRQISLLESGGKVENETRSYSDALKQTVPMRDKEAKQDYRFMPEPNLPPLRLAVGEEASPGLVSVAEIRRKIPPLPADIRRHLMEHHNLSFQSAMALLDKEDVLRFFKDLVAWETISGKVAWSFIFNVVFPFLRKHELEFTKCPIEFDILRETCNLCARSQLTMVGAKEILGAMYAGDRRPVAEIVQSLGLSQITDPNVIEKLCTEVIESTNLVVEKILRGKQRKQNLALLAKKVVELSKNRIASKDALRTLESKISLICAN